MNERKDIRTELEELGAAQLRASQGQISRPHLSPERLQAIAAAARAEVDSETIVRSISPRSSFNWHWAAAAVIALLLGLAVWRLPVQPTDTPQPIVGLEELSETDILAYVEANIDEFEWELFEDILEKEASVALPPMNELPDTAIESYLETADDWLDEVY